jgi:hypothetical protein
VKVLATVDCWRLFKEAAGGKMKYFCQNLQHAWGWWPPSIAGTCWRSRSREKKRHYAKAW